MKKVFIFTALAFSVALGGCVPQAEKPSGVNLEDQSSQSINNNQGTTMTEKYSRAVISTNFGDIIIQFYNDDAPNTVNNFTKLAAEGFYDDVKFHRVIKDFMIQSGDPLSKDNAQMALWGTGGPGYAFADEFNNRKLVRGSLAMANSGPNSNGSQFFIVTAAATPWLDGRHTNFGEVVEGMEVVSKIESIETESSDRPINHVVISSIRLVK